MTVVCDFQRCPFYDNGFCAREVVGIKAGVCNFVYKVEGDGRVTPRIIRNNFKKETEVRVIE